MSLDPLFVFLGEVCVQAIHPFLNWVACLLRMESCEFFIYFGDQTLVRGIIGKYIFPYNFPYNICSLSILLLFSFAMQKLFYFDEHLFILPFMSLALRDISVKILLCAISEIFLPMFSSRTFMVLRHIFKSFIHLEFTGVYVVSWRLSFILLHVAVQFSQQHLWRDYFYSILCFFPFVKY